MDMLSLVVHEGKTLINDVRHGVAFLGAYVLPYRTYTSRSTLERMDAKLNVLEKEDDSRHLFCALNSYCGVLSHGNNYHVRKMMLIDRHRFSTQGTFDGAIRHFLLGKL